MNTWKTARVSLPDGRGFDRWTLDSLRPGLRVVVFGGTHGDETEGVIAANQLAGSQLVLTTGVLEVVPIVHEAAYFNDSRTSPLDDGNLARAFPGDPAGTPTQVLAHALHNQVLVGADLLIDLHTAGQGLDMPYIAGYIDDGRDKRGLSRRAAEAFGADFVWRHPTRAPGRTLSDMDAAIYTEAPLPGPIRLDFADRYRDGVLRVLGALGMIDCSVVPSPMPGALRVVSGGNVDTDMQSVRCSGLFIHKSRQGEKVTKGQLLAVVVDIRGQVLEEICALFDGWVVVLKRRPHVKSGDQVVAVAVADETD